MPKYLHLSNLNCHASIYSNGRLEIILSIYETLKIFNCFIIKIDNGANLAYNNSTIVKIKVVDVMSFKENLEKLFKSSSGILTTKNVEDSGIPRQYLWILKNENKIQMIARGIYISNEVFEDEMCLIQLRTNKAIFSHETALYIHNLTDRDPLFYTVTLPSGYNPSRLKNSNIEVHTVKKELFEIGKTTAKTIYGRNIMVYDKERTICDIIRNRKNMDKYILNDALKRYVNSKGKDIFKLTKFAKLFRIQKILDSYLEVLL